MMPEFAWMVAALVALASVFGAGLFGEPYLMEEARI